MEQIVWRAVVAAALLGIVLGVPSMILGSRSQESMQALWLEASEKAGAENDACLEVAGGNAAAQGQCYEVWNSAYSSNSWMMTSSAQSGDAIVRGFLMAVVLPLLLFSAFFLLRWIGTGRWRRKPTSAQG